MSLFVAVRPTFDVVEHLDERVQQLRRLPAARELRWQPVARWHVTLAFLGDPAADAEPDAAEALEEATGACAPIEGLRLAGCGVFDRQVLWVGLEDGAALEGLRALAGAVTAALRRAGLRPDHRPWRPHLTLARSRSRQADAVLASLAGYRGPAWTVDEVLLVRSTGGPRPDHQVRASTALGGPDGADSSQGGGGAAMRGSADATSPKRASPPLH